MNVKLALLVLAAALGIGASGVTDGQTGSSTPDPSILTRFFNATLANGHCLSSETRGNSATLLSLACGNYYTDYYIGGGLEITGARVVVHLDAAANSSTCSLQVRYTTDGGSSWNNYGSPVLVGGGNTAMDQIGEETLVAVPYTASGSTGWRVETSDAGSSCSDASTRVGVSLEGYRP